MNNIKTGFTVTITGTQQHITSQNAKHEFATLTKARQFFLEMYDQLNLDNKEENEDGTMTAGGIGFDYEMSLELPDRPTGKGWLTDIGIDQTGDDAYQILVYEEKHGNRCAVFGKTAEECEETAQLICKAVNSHAELLEALKLMTKRAEMRYPHFERGDGSLILEKANAAIDKAELIG